MPIVVSVLAIIVGSLFPHDAFGKINVNSTTMMAIDTDTGMKMNPFSGMLLPKNTGTMTMNNAATGMMVDVRQ